MSTATFIGYDLITGPNWQAPSSVRGTAGYSLSDSSATTLVQSLPAYITSVDYSAFNWAGSGNSPLTRPGGGAPLYGRYYTIGTAAAPVSATDGATHYLSIYCADDVGGGRTQIVSILDASGAVLDSHTIDYNFEGGVWLCFQVSGVVKVQLQVAGASPNAVFSGMAWDETQPALANARTTIPATGSLAVDSVAITGTATAGGGAIDATGSLAVESIAVAGTAGVVVPASGSLAVEAISLTGSAGVAIPASGSLAVEAISLTGSAGLSVAASGSLAVESIAITGTATTSGGAIAATGSLAVESLGLTGSAGLSVPASGSLALDSISITGSSSSIVAATGSLAVDSIVVGGSVGVTVPATGSLAVDSIGLSGSAGLSVPAVGSLAVESIAITGTATTSGGAIAATGSLAVESIVVAGTAGILVPAVGSLLVGPILITGAGPSVGPSALREALVARLGDLPGLVGQVADRFYPSTLPQLGALPAVTYSVAARSNVYNLSGVAGLSVARVRVSSWARTEAGADAVAMAVREGLDGFRGSWGRVVVLFCTLVNEADLPDPPRGGSDRSTYQIALDFQITYRVTIPA
jgi:hypothetical protein